MKAPRNHELLKIMIVDDSDFNRKSMESILLNEGFNVIATAKSAEEAITLAHTAKPNLLFIDVVMPEISGLELARHLQEKNSQDRYIIMMSSLTVESMVIEAISSGAVDYLQKPFGASDLIKSVEKIEKIVERN